MIEHYFFEDFKCMEVNLFVLMIEHHFPIITAHALNPLSSPRIQSSHV